MLFRSQEVVVNKNFQVYSAYRVTYRPGGALPDPLSRAGNDALKTFDEYKASDFHCQAQNVLLPHMLCHRREEAEATWQRNPAYNRWLQEKSDIQCDPSHCRALFESFEQQRAALFANISGIS